MIRRLQPFVCHPQSPFEIPIVEFEPLTWLLRTDSPIHLVAEISDFLESFCPNVSVISQLFLGCAAGITPQVVQIECRGVRVMLEVP